MATKYKIGDEVVLINVYPWEKRLGLKVGMKGKIVELAWTRWANVSFKGWHKGHTDEQQSCWEVELED